MANLYTRRTALSNVGGRIKYVDRDIRKYKNIREDLLAKYDGAAELLQGNYWKILAEECQAAWELYAPQKKTKINRRGKKITLKAREAQELVIQLPNSLILEDLMKPGEIATILGQGFEQYAGRPCHVAIHWNHKKNNLHAHLIYAERQHLREQEIKVAERRLFFDEQGKRHYKKAEILDESGQLRPGCSIIEKGQIYSQRAFSPVNQRIGSRQWLAELKTEWLLPLLNGPLRGDITYQEYDPDSGKIPQQHVGKEPTSERRQEIEKLNQLIVEYNQAVDQELIRKELARQAALEVRRHREKRGVLELLVELIRMKLDPDYIPGWAAPYHSRQRNFEFNIDRELQAALDVLAIAQEYGVSGEQGLQDAREMIGHNLAMARAAADREAEAKAKREYAIVAQHQRRQGLALDDRLAAAEQRTTPAKRRSTKSEKEK